MSVDEIDSLLRSLTSAVKTPEPDRPAACAVALKRAFEATYRFAGPTHHVREVREWLRFAAENADVKADSAAHAKAAQALSLLRGVRDTAAVTIDALIVAALEDELEPVRSGTKWQRERQPFPHERGKLVGLDVVLARCSGMGLVEASILTTRALSHYRPRVVVMVGICGALDERAKVGDVIVANPSFHYQIGAYEDGILKHELKTANLKQAFVELADAFGKNEFISIRGEFDGRTPRPPAPSTMKVAPMACADLVVKDPAKIQDAIEAERKTTALDMESYAVMRACGTFEVPCIVIKAVQDVMVNKTDNLRSYAAALAASVLVGMLPQLVRSA